MDGRPASGAAYYFGAFFDNAGCNCSSWLFLIADTNDVGINQVYLAATLKLPYTEVSLLWDFQKICRISEFRFSYLKHFFACIF